MSNRSKKLEEELLLRLLEVSEDPTFDQDWRHNDKKGLIGVMIDFETEEQPSLSEYWIGTIH